jgi:phosphoglycerol transferase MdoB-like AlkP superfamily enzyme
LLLRLIGFWTLWFAGARALFYLWFLRSGTLPSGSLIAQSFLYGMRMDLSAAAYLTVIPWLLATMSIGGLTQSARRAISIYSVAIIALVTVITLTDLGTYGPWRRRLDASIWTYLATPQEAYASASSLSVLPLVLMLIVLVPLTVWLHRRVVLRTAAAWQPARGWAAVRAGLACFVSGLLLFIPIRGGVQWTPMNESSVLFSNSDVVNQASQNAGWFLLYSTLARQHVPTTNPYAVSPTADARRVVDSLYATSSAPVTSLLRVSHPNVVLIIWESFTTKVVQRLGGRDSVTPQFDRWSHQGVLFDSLFASGERSAQGLLSILSGFPSVPNEAIMTRPERASLLPQLGTSLKQAGYHTSYYYGGELAFANMKAYVVNGGFDRITGIEAFARSERGSKWGAHDHVVLGRVLQEVASTSRPFFTTVFTLSSHEPFEIPVSPQFPGADESTQFLSAHHYSDASIGAFLDSAARQPWWDSTLVVIVADHGSPLPVPLHSAAETVVERHHIPMLWLGGALRVRDTVVHRIGASTDIAPTLLGQLNIVATDFRWGQSLLRTGSGGFAYFSNNDGFAFIDPTGWMVYSERPPQVIEQSPRATSAHQRKGSALLQTSFDDYLSPH